MATQQRAKLKRHKSEKRRVRFSAAKIDDHKSTPIRSRSRHRRSHTDLAKYFMTVEYRS